MYNFIKKFCLVLGTLEIACILLGYVLALIYQAIKFEEFCK